MYQKSRVPAKQPTSTTARSSFRPGRSSSQSQRDHMAKNAWRLPLLAISLNFTGWWLTYPSEKSWSESQLGWWNSQLIWLESHKVPWFQSPPSSLAFTRLLLIPSSMGKTTVEHLGCLPPKEIDQFVNPSSREDLKLNLPLVLSSQFLRTFPALPGRKRLPNHPKSLQSPTLWSLAISNFGTKNIYTVAD